MIRRIFAPVLAALALLCAPAAAPAQESHAGLAELFAADQADRTPPPGAPRDFFVGMEARDSSRRARVAALVDAGAPRTGADFYHAAMVMQHGVRTADYLRAHELATVAAALGHAPARWLMAASLDRLLLSMGRPQRFGTQSRFMQAEQRFHLEPVEEGVTDDMRRALGVAPLRELRERVAEQNQQIEARRRP